MRFFLLGVAALPDLCPNQPCLSTVLVIVSFLLLRVKADANPFSEAKVYYAYAKFYLSKEKINLQSSKRKGFRPQTTNRPL